MLLDACGQTVDGLLAVIWVSWVHLKIASIAVQPV
jgi:hypothetical protein